MVAFILFYQLLFFREPFFVPGTLGWAVFLSGFLFFFLLAFGRRPTLAAVAFGSRYASDHRSHGFGFRLV